MAREAAERRLAAILAADVAGYSLLMERDETGTLAALKRHREGVLFPAVQNHKGRVVKLMGDGALVEFLSVVDAVNCAIEVQRTPAPPGPPNAPDIVLRIGINLGDVIIEGSDIYGDGVNVAARLEPLAEPGGICISAIVCETIGNRALVAFRDGGEIRIKNIDRPIRVWKWHPDDPAVSHEAPARPPVREPVDPNAFGSALSEILTRISMDKGVPVAPLKAILVRLGEQDVPAERIADRLAAKADEFLKLKTDLSQASRTASDISSVRKQAIGLLEKGDLDAARTALSGARLHLAQMRQEQSLAEASLISDEASIDMLQLRYREAAEKYAEAARLADFDRQTAFDYIQRQGDALYASGAEFGDNQALLQMIELWQGHLRTVSQMENPLEWATVQAALGAALWKLGARERGSARLKEAVIACRAACDAYSKETDPILWATAHQSLGNALQDLGVRDREDGVIYLEEAVAAYRAALEVRTRETTPREWGLTITNLALSLQRLAERQAGTAGLKEAVALYREALTVRTRQNTPLDWAATLSNMGMSLHLLGERDGNVEQIKEAISHFREALEVRTRQRVPLAWAGTQFNLGNALRSLGELSGHVAFFEEAAEAYRSTLEEWTREKLPLDWAQAYGKEGLVLMRVAARRSDAILMENGYAQVCVAVQALRDGEHTQLEAYFDAELANARRLRDEMTGKTAAA